MNPGYSGRNVQEIREGTTGRDWKVRCKLILQAAWIQFSQATLGITVKRASDPGGLGHGAPTVIHQTLFSVM